MSQKNTYFHLECGQENRFSPTFGPFEFVQLTYDLLRVGPNGVEVAFFDQKSGGWLFSDRPEVVEVLGKGEDTFKMGQRIGNINDWYSDVVIFGK